MFLLALGRILVVALSFLSQTECTSDPRSRIARRQAHHRPKSIINSSFRSANGTKLPSNLRTKVYVQPRIKSLDGLTNRGIMGERVMNQCASETGEFHHSHCQHKRDIVGSFRTYIIWCQELQPTSTYTGVRFPAAATAMATVMDPVHDDQSLYAEIGICAADEVCVDSLYASTWRSDLVLTANCVNVKYFKEKFTEEDLADGDYEDQGREDGEDEGGSSSGGLDGRTASVVVTQDDEQTPQQVHGIDVSLYDISEDGSSSGLGSEDDAAAAAAAGSKLQQEKNCTDCFELRTSRAFLPSASPKQTGDLELEVSLISAGSAALTGVLWVALMSG